MKYHIGDKVLIDYDCAKYPFSFEHIYDPDGERITDALVISNYSTEEKVYKVTRNWQDYGWYVESRLKPYQPLKFK